MAADQLGLDRADGFWLFWLRRPPLTIGLNTQIPRSVLLLSQISERIQPYLEATVARVDFDGDFLEDLEPNLLIIQSIV